MVFVSRTNCTVTWHSNYSHVTSEWAPYFLDQSYSLSRARGSNQGRALCDQMVKTPESYNPNMTGSSPRRAISSPRNFVGQEIYWHFIDQVNSAFYQMTEDAERAAIINIDFYNMKSKKKKKWEYWCPLYRPVGRFGFFRLFLDGHVEPVVAAVWRAATLQCIHRLDQHTRILNIKFMHCNDKRFTVNSHNSVILWFCIVLYSRGHKSLSKTTDYTSHSL